MNEASSIDGTTIDEIYNDSEYKDKLNDMEWSKEHENILVEWADKAMCYRWLHSYANRKFSQLSRMFTIPVIIISTVTGTANFAQDRVPIDYVSTFVMCVGALNIIAGIITTIQQFLKVNELNEAHRVSSISWDKFYRNIKMELAKKPEERIPVGQMLKFSKEEYDRLMETSPILQEKVINKFKKTFKHSANFIRVKKPEICDELISTDQSRYVKVNVSKKQDIMKKIVTTAKEMDNLSKKINEFYDKFIISNNRQPTKEEIKDYVNELNMNLTNELLDKAINNKLNKEQKISQSNV